MQKEITIWSLADAKKQHVHSKELLQLLESYLPLQDLVYDFGCGLGYYINGLTEAGFNCIGIEGTPGISEIALFRNIVEADLTKPMLFEQYGTVISFEVAEHIMPEFENEFLTNLLTPVQDFLIISWAIEGQGGYGHNNCRNADYVIPKIESMGFEFQKDDSLYFRKIAGSGICPWFKNTIYIFRKI